MLPTDISTYPLTYLAAGLGAAPRDERALASGGGSGLGDYHGVSLWPAWLALANASHQHDASTPWASRADVRAQGSRQIVIEHNEQLRDAGSTDAGTPNHAAVIELREGRALKFMGGDVAQCGHRPRGKCPVPLSLYSRGCGDAGCLYDLIADPTEQVNLAAAMPADLARIRAYAYALPIYRYNSTFDAGRNDAASCARDEAAFEQHAWDARAMAGGFGVLTSLTQEEWPSPPPAQPAPPSNPPTLPTSPQLDLPSAPPPRSPYPSSPSLPALPTPPVPSPSAPPLPLPRSPPPPPTLPPAPTPPPPPVRVCSDCPNLLLLLTEDQDAILGGWDPTGWPTPMPQAQRRVAERGVAMAEWRVASPLCAPSRATLLTGRHLHNLANPSSATPASEAQFRNFSGGRGHLDLPGEVWPHVFGECHVGSQPAPPAAACRWVRVRLLSLAATRLRDEQGFATGLFGKCMNGGCGEASDTGGINLRNERAFSRWFESVRGDPHSTTFFDSEAVSAAWQCQGIPTDASTVAADGPEPVSLAGRMSLGGGRGLHWRVPRRYGRAHTGPRVLNQRDWQRDGSMAEESLRCHHLERRIKF